MHNCSMNESRPQSVVDDGDLFGVVQSTIQQSELDDVSEFARESISCGM